MKHPLGWVAKKKLPIPRMGLSRGEIDDLVFLVEHHLLMAHVSQRRDMHDIELIISSARRLLPRPGSTCSTS